EKKPDETHFLKIKFLGDQYNKKGLGAYATLYHDGNKIQYWENTPYRGYLSTVDELAFFGLGKTSKIDSVKIEWPGNKIQVLETVKIDTVLTVSIKDAKVKNEDSKSFVVSENYLTEVTRSKGVQFIHKEKDFVDFNIQKLLPHKYSEFGPALAVGDINNDGNDDIICGGSIGYSAQIMLQQKDGSFQGKLLTTDTGFAVKKSQDLGMLLFDADNDKDLDLYIASGGFSQKPESEIYQDKFYKNDGKGNFSIDTFALPLNHTSKFAVKAIDFDKDGDLDVFVSGRVDPWNYPKPVSSYLYRNDSKDGKVVFTDVTKNIAKDLINIGMVCDALFTDFNNDGWMDLILTGEWMPVTFLKNERGVFKNVTALSGINKKIGWWNSIVSGDFDNDGDLDYVIGNVGENSLYRASEQYPVSVYADDYDNNGSYDAIPSLYFPSSMEDKTKKEFPAFGRDDLIKQMISMRSKFQSYRHYAESTMDSVLTPEQMKKSLIYRANNFRSCIILNQGNGVFKIEDLPVEAQFSTLCGMISDDINDDGNLDLIINGNDYSPEVFSGRNDALNGLVMLGDGKGHFKSLKIIESGLFIPGNGKALVRLTDSNGSSYVAGSQNRGALKIFKLKKNKKIIKLNPDDESVELQFKNGKKQMQENYYGHSYLSQSSRFITIDSTVNSIRIRNAIGTKRIVENR
ncbi:MAG: FG-GAP-like repeat-containing protein, partial [Chitinophagaceae bacterium]